MTVPFARARAKLGGSIRESDVTVKVIFLKYLFKTCISDSVDHVW